ncbi:Cell cycle control protein 50B [Acipenser ruthenus]|uniref:Cell cycle control protein n=1 Tax=Acipenser ruthenus TaxID=7906 RepID=A0A444UYW8_ACIRT|nr:Cell cycle control protein 50B [Acipenser ruthenus]
MGKEDPKVSKPDNTAFTQQRLPAWQPILSAGIVLPLFVVIGLTFIGIGIGLFITSSNVQEIEGPVFMYYGLTNYYQNYRKYGISRDDDQLFGNIDSLKSPANFCSPYQMGAKQMPIAPCGAIANSLFNDTFRLFYKVNEVYTEVLLDDNGISWWTDYNVKFRNPPEINGSLKNAFEGTVKPLNWPKPVYELSTNPNNNGFINQDFLVWMRIAALPNFRKLYRRISEGNWSRSLPAGNYSLEITYNYPVLSFQGKKKVVFSTVTWMGGKNSFLGIAYLVFGSLSIVMALIMLIVYAKYQVQIDRDM